jgi:heme a synthase
MNNSRNAIALSYWLMTCCFMIVMMIVIGAVTRLTESGLSIVDWHALKDMLPPMNEAAWGKLFADYQQTPEYIKVNSTMTAEEFKTIYFWEWLHRLWGRLIGLVYALPLIYFWVRGKIPSELKPRFIGYFIVGGLQGAVGWFMVKSGLIHEPRVSHFRLAAHLFLALLLLGLLWHQIFALWPRSVKILKDFKYRLHPSMKTHFWIGLVLLLLAMLWGVFTAGLDAGLACSDFPKTCAQWWPQEIMFEGQPFRNILHEPTAVQFVHRLLATLAFLALFSLGLRLIKTRDRQLRKLGLTVHVLILVQWLLGIATIHSQVNLHTAVTHQFIAVLNLLVMIKLMRFIRKPIRS